jgi:hypothetical protein
VGVSPRFALFAWREFPHPPRSSSAATSPASGRGEVSPRLGQAKRYRDHRSSFGFNCQAARGCAFAFSRRDAPELCVDCHPLKQQEGAGKAGCALHPRSRVQNAQEKTHTSIQVQRRQSGLPCAVVYGLFRARPGDRAFLPPSPALLSANLTPASGCQAHTASPSATTAFVIRRHRVHRIPPHVRDDRDPPLSSGETGGAKALICPTG